MGENQKKQSISDRSERNSRPVQTFFLRLCYFWSIGRHQRLKRLVLSNCQFFVRRDLQIWAKYGGVQDPPPPPFCFRIHPYLSLIKPFLFVFLHKNEKNTLKHQLTAGITILITQKVKKSKNGGGGIFVCKK